MRVWILFALALIASPALAQKQEATFGQWKASCTPREGTMSCVVELALTDKGVRPFFGGLLIFPTNNTLMLLAGSNIAYGSVKTDKGDLFVCPSGPLCSGDDDEAKKFTQSLLTAGLLTLKIRTGRDNFEFEASTSGYKRALAQINAWGHGTKKP